MRLSFSDSAKVILYFLPLLISYCKIGVISTIFIIFLWSVFNLYLKHKKLKSKPKQNLKLVSILISHYSEKVRWCLEFCNIDFEEEFDSAIFGMLFFNRSIPTLYNPLKRVKIGNSSDILRYIYGSYCGQNEKVLKLLKPTKENLKMEALFDEKLGRAIQRIFYFGMFWFFVNELYSVCIYY